MLTDVTFDSPPGGAYGVVSGPVGNLWVLVDDLGGYGADEVGRYVHANEPIPSLNVSAVSNRSVGGSMTVCVHASQGSIVGTFLSLSGSTLPFATPWGNAWILPDVGLPVFGLWNSDRAYLTWSVGYDPILLDLPVHMQAIELAPSGVMTLTNPTTFVLRG